MRPASTAAVAGRVAAWRPHAAVVFGSGLARLPRGAEAVDEISYGDLRWPCTAVPGHHNVLRLVRLAAVSGRELRLALACGRPHRYEGWSDRELELPVRALTAAGVRRLLLTNCCGGLRAEVAPGAAVVCDRVVDLQSPPLGTTLPAAPVCGADEAARLTAALAALPARRGTYVALAGPQFESPAEVRWLARYGDVVGMSALPELRAARAAGASCALIALVVNRAAEVGSHEDVLAVSGRLAGALADHLLAGILARWPELAY